MLMTAKKYHDRKNFWRWIFATTDYDLTNLYGAARHDFNAAAMTVV